MDLQIDPNLKWLMGTSILGYVLVMYVIGFVSYRRVRTLEDYVVAGRRLPLSLAWMTLLATWFGAGTLLTAADEVRSDGLQAAALDPFGAGICLILAGAFVAAPLWRMSLLTLPEFYRRKYGPRAEFIAAVIMVPSYFGWIAAQFVALAEVMHLFFGIPVEWGLTLVAIVGTGYTLMGGMWSVTLTDALQIALVMGCLLILAATVLMRLGAGDPFGGVERLLREVPAEKLEVIPTKTFASFVGWLGVLATGALGNIPGQDLMQRVFASKSERVARRACFIAGTAYLSFGLLPLMLALAGSVIFPEGDQVKILPALAHEFLSPSLAVIFVVAILSAVLSTIDSAILAPACILAQNVFPRFTHADPLRTNRLAVLLVATSSLVLAYVGDDAYALLENAYLMPLAGLFVPLILGLYSTPQSGKAAVASMLAGISIWGIHFALGWENFLEGILPDRWFALPIALVAPGFALLVFFIFEPPWRISWHRPTCERTTHNNA